jgi:pimeloyl-ACP methyl ester carboxylesterase
MSGARFSRALFVAAGLLCLLAPAVAGRGKESRLQGYWEGSVTREGKVWRVNFEIKQAGAEKGFTAVADFVDAGGLDRVFTVEYNAPRVRLSRPQPNGPPIVFDGSVAGDTLSGRFNGLGTTAEFTLRRRGNAKPCFHREEAVTFMNGEVSLSGTLLLPLGKTAPLPAVVFAHGGAPEARLVNKDWALRFVRRGIAALIYDKRGVGESTGDWRTANLDELAGDVLAGVRLLKARRDLDPRRIAAAGHSQGGTIAPLAALKSRDINFVISSAPSGVNYAEQSVYHRANVMRESGFSEEAVGTASALRERLYATGRMLLANDPRAGDERRKISAELEKYRDAPWLEAAALPPNLDNDQPSKGALELLFFEPRPVWEGLRVPALFIWGDKDTVVPVEKGRRIIESARHRRGVRDYTIKVFPNVTHFTTISRPQGAEWDFPRVSSVYLDATAEWLAARVNGSPRSKAASTR